MKRDETRLMRQIDSQSVFRGRKAQFCVRMYWLIAVALICSSVVENAFCADVPPGQPANIIRPNVPVDWLQRIEDDKAVATSNENVDEHKAYDRFLLFARKQPLDALAQNVNKDVDSLKLMSSERSRFRGDLAHLEGRLIRLVRIAADDELQKAGIREVYEGWVREENNINPVGVIVSELPADLKPGEKLSRFVAVDGYFFKLYRYTDPEGNERRAPLLIGRTFSKSEPAPEEVEQPKATAGPSWKMDCPIAWLEHIEDDH